MAIGTLAHGGRMEDLGTLETGLLGDTSAQGFVRRMSATVMTVERQGSARRRRRRARLVSLVDACWCFGLKLRRLPLNREGKRYD